MLAAVPDVPARAHDPESEAWLRDLRADGRREEAAARLHALLLRAARYAVASSRGLLPQLSDGELDQIAVDAASDATIAVLARLDDFRGESRFATWAYKFALLGVSAKLRQRDSRGRGREVPTEPEDWPTRDGAGEETEQTAERDELLEWIGVGVAEALTERQRRVLVAVAVNGLPIHVVAERLGTTHGAVYKALHEARRKLRDYLADRGLRPPGGLSGSSGTEPGRSSAGRSARG